MTHSPVWWVCAHVPLCDMESVTKCIIHTVMIPFVIQIRTPLGQTLTPGRQAWTETVLGKPRHMVTLHNAWHREEQKTSWKGSLQAFPMASPQPFLSASVTEVPAPSLLPLGSLPRPVATRPNPPHAHS